MFYVMIQIRGVAVDVAPNKGYHADRLKSIDFGGENLVRNCDVRDAATEKGVRLWQIAEELGVADYNFSRRLRKELSDEEKERVFAIIERLSEGGVAGVRN